MRRALQLLTVLAVVVLSSGQDVIVVRRAAAAYDCTAVDETKFTAFVTFEGGATTGAYTITAGELAPANMSVVEGGTNSDAEIAASGALSGTYGVNAEVDVGCASSCIARYEWSDTFADNLFGATTTTGCVAFQFNITTRTAGTSIIIALASQGSFFIVTGNAGETITTSIADSGNSTTAGTYADGSPHHVALCWDTDGGADDFSKFYVDGTLVTTDTGAITAETFAGNEDVIFGVNTAAAKDFVVLIDSIFVVTDPSMGPDLYEIMTECAAYTDLS